MILPRSLNLNYSVTHFTIHGGESPRRNKGIGPICIGMAEIFISELTSCFCVLCCCLDPTFTHLEQRIKAENADPDCREQLRQKYFYPGDLAAPGICVRCRNEEGI